MSTVFAGRVRASMRAHKVTIRQVAAAMQVTQARVREVRATGKPPAWSNASEHCWMLDWFDGIRKAADSRPAQ